MIGALVAGITGSGGASLSSFESIATTTLTGTQTGITISSIPSTFKHLQIRVMAGSSYASAGYDLMQLRFNNDSATNYADHNLTGDGATATAGGQVTRTFIETIGFLVRTGTSANIFGVSVIDILDYASTSKYKTVRALGGEDRNGSGNIRIGSGLWLSTNAINRIDFCHGESLKTGTTIALYGIKEA